MERNNIDNIFKEQLSGIEITPISVSWNDLEPSLMGQRKTLKWSLLKVAASIILLIGVSLILTRVTSTVDEENISFISSENISYPRLLTPNETKWTETSFIMSSQKASQVILVEEEKSETQLARTVNDKLPILEIQSITKIEITTPDSSLDQNDINYLSTSAESIKIRYVAKQSPSEKFTFDKALGLAQKTSPADLLASLRNAKNEFLNETFRLN